MTQENIKLSPVNFKVDPNLNTESEIRATEYAHVLGFIGFGNMAKAFADGILRSKVLDQEQLVAFAPSAKTRGIIEARGIKACNSALSVTFSAKYIVLACKPYHWPDLKKILVFKPDQVLISFMLGVGFDGLYREGNGQPQYMLMMPNTPVMVGQGATGYAVPDQLSSKKGSPFGQKGPTEENEAEITNIFSKATLLTKVSGSLLPAIVGVSGSGPAYVYEFINAMADGGVKAGLDKETAIKMAAQTVSGAAQMVLQTGKHPAQLRDSVCSPGGSSIEGVVTLHQYGFHNAVMQCIQNVVERAKNKK